MKSRLLILPIAGLLLTGAAGAVLAQSAGSTPAAADTVAAAASAAPTVADPAHRGDGLVTDVLADLVTKGTITQAQSDAITTALDAARTARQAEREALRALWQTIMADGQITEEERKQLPEDSPLRNIEGILDDGVITRDELRELGGFGFGGRGGHGPGGHGPMTPDDAAAPSASPTTGS